MYCNICVAAKPVTATHVQCPLASGNIFEQQLVNVSFLMLKAQWARLSTSKRTQQRLQLLLFTCPVADFTEHDLLAGKK